MGSPSIGRAAVYCRVSRDQGGEGLGVARQEADCRAWCEQRGWPVAEAFVDNDVSAYSGKRRPAFERMVDGIKAGRFDAIVVWHPDRLTRSTKELEGIIDLVEATGAAVGTVTAGDYDLTTPEGRFTARIVGAVARKESEDKSRRIRRKHQELAENGKPAGGGTRPFGFEKDGVTIREDEADLIREAAGRLLTGASLYSIQRDWETRGIPTAKAVRADGTRVAWSVTSIKTTLTRPRIAGLRQYQGEVAGLAAWPAILDRETWERLRIILTDPSRRQPPPSREYPLYPLLRCGSCGRQLTAMPRKNGRNYGCRKYSGGCGHVFVAAAHIEPYVLSVVLPLADSPAILGTIEVANADVRADMEALALAVAEDEHARAQLADDHYQARIIDRATFLRQELALRARIEDNRIRLAALQPAGSLDQLTGRVASEWGNLTPEQRRQLLWSVLSGVVVSPARRPGSNLFDRSRIAFGWRWDALAKIAAEHAETMMDTDWSKAEAEYADLCRFADDNV
jgi:DNA invertase Pin-like site-specific DNA recombinase